MTVARDPTDIMDRAVHSVEMSTVTLGMFVLGWCRTRTVTSPATERWHQALAGKGVTLGGWTALLEGADTALGAHPNDPAARAMQLAAKTMVPFLKEFVQIRNRYAHGGRPRVRGDVEGAARALAESVTMVLDRIEPLTSLRLGIVRSCGKEARARLYDIDLDVMTGYAELFPSQRLRCRRPFDDGTVLAYGANTLEYAVDLTPYCVWRRCDSCGRDELFYLTKRKPKRSDYYSFSTGHQLQLKQGASVSTPEPMAQMAMAPLGSRRAASYGWRASWADLAPRYRRLAARLIDVVIALVTASLGGLFGLVVGLPVLWAVVLAVLLAAAFEPVSAVAGGSLGKRLVRIEAISVWDCRPLGRRDRLRRALAADLQMLPPFAVRSLAWLLWDPARQCLHDRFAASIVVSGRSRSTQKR
jgi:hypothetical protein